MTGIRPHKVQPWVSETITTLPFPFGPCLLHFYSLIKPPCALFAGWVGWLTLSSPPCRHQHRICTLLYVRAGGLDQPFPGIDGGGSAGFAIGG